MDDTKIGILFNLMKHPDELESLADALKSVDTCQTWEDDVIFKAADVIIGLSQIFKASMPCNACNNCSELNKFSFSDYYNYFLLGLIKCYDDSVDPDDIAKQADAYVRDHLLIQYMMWKFGKACMLDIEDIYDEWIKWLEEKE